ncbi:carboxypeptidase-like regulatory domain-containing protein [Flavobacterium azooxidireducens]|uniref:Carboxypeptidase-like regulatory domain-containing protein n=1 Tax=Flavobacterium azooxidireducens TaxID=1871076 RepID=A0ABY4KGV2_9FLAO|nr:carboxypeptidase-like regulatory domain-containing protein [Flavobacterium azooxidireducens]UPQ78682.1 carboxypeptidase-like regulatory domain-containing protein [Flavobacterium azooxidireducens]
MKVKLMTLMMFLCLSQIMAQTINGKIVDENNSPLYGVSVYFDGTTIGTTTDNNGFFELNVQSLPNATLVISYIGYESVYLNTIQSPIELKLEPSSFALKEVVLEPIPFSRKEMLKVFREQFLGKTKGGKNCVILNEDAIQFSYTSKEFKLTAFADEKIKVRNNYLGYIIEVDLVDFYVAYNKRTLSNDYLRGSYFAVTSFFKEIEEVNKSYEKNRNTSYLGSSKHFFKNLIEKKWGKKEFLLFDGSFPTDANLHFEISDDKNMKLVKVNGRQITTNSLTTQKFYRSFNMLYNNKEQSKIIFKTAEFYVDAFGNHTHIDQIDFSGEISKKRFGDMLPLNFEP